MELFRKMKVYDEVPRASAAADGCKVISARWVDINKGYQKSPELMCKTGWPGTQDGSTARLVRCHTASGSLEVDLLSVCEQSRRSTAVSYHDG